MDERPELRQIIYDFLAAQIEFGACRYGEPLPRMEDAARWCSVSLDTVRAAYLRLQREGYITLTQKAGAAVAVRFPEGAQEEHIRTFFAPRREAVLDLCRSLGPLFGRAQYFALRQASPERLSALEGLSARPGPPPAYQLFSQVRLIYGGLHNDLLLRLVWQALLFYQAPFVCLPGAAEALAEGDPLPGLLALCRRRDWAGLRRAVDDCQEGLSAAIGRFYAGLAGPEPPGEAVPFRWNAYRSSTQRCYSLAMGLLEDIHLGRLPREGYLPAPARLAEERRVSVSTVRRALALLNQLGAARSVNGVGTLALPTGESAEHCDFTQPVIRKRLLDFAQSLQLLALTCGPCALGAFAAMDAGDRAEYGRELAAMEEAGRCESVVFATLSLIPRSSPVQAIREIYGQLLQILIWGYPLRGLHGDRAAIEAYYRPYVRALAGRLEAGDGPGLAAVLEDLLRRELRFALARLNELGIEGSAALKVPEPEPA